MDGTSKFLLQLVTPEKKSFDDVVDQVTIPTIEGNITVLPNHMSLVTSIKPGELIVKQGSKETNIASGFGFAQITGQQVSILTDLAEEAENISEKEAEEARRRAEDTLKEKERLSSEEYAAVAAALEKSLVRLRVKRRHRLKV
ncbi:ATP synthase F1 subunit epsilon [Patescibacteria group bacterium]|nr:ATP synthase F1 subunit epsilon [Patescibacteria group bacterium]